MKKLLFLPLLVLLTGCVTYYYPETALEDGIYYAEDDPSYNVYQGHYPGYAYYPWSSMDYFYMGYHPYPRYAYYHGFHHGYSYGYSPWHYPFAYYGHYSPLYASYYHYPYYPVWRPYNGYCSHYDGCGRRQGNQHDAAQKRLVGKSKKSRKRPADSGVNDDGMVNDLAEQQVSEYNTATLPYGPYGSYGSTMPSGYSGSQGMLIGSSNSEKIGKSLIQPGGSTPTSNGITVVGGSSSTPVLTSGSKPVLTSVPVNGTRSSSTRSSSARPPSSSTSRSVSSPRMSSKSRHRAGSSSRSSGRTSRNSMQSPKKDRD